MSILEAPISHESEEKTEEEKREEERLEVIYQLLDIKKTIEESQLKLKKKFTSGKNKEILDRLPHDFEDLLDSVAEYIRVADTHEFNDKETEKEVDVQSLALRESLGKNRIATHNMLISSINILAHDLNILGIDKNPIYAINKRGEKLDPKLNMTDGQLSIGLGWSVDICPGFEICRGGIP